MTNTEETQPQNRLDDARERLIAAYNDTVTAGELIAALEDFVQEKIKEAVRMVVGEGNTASWR